MAVPDEQVIAGWAASGSRMRQIAATLAHELAKVPHGERVDSSVKIARRFGASNTMAVHARYLLTGQRIIHKSGRHYYVGPPEETQRDA
jgi:hypothetical protein